jgi:hypothetical protein
MEKNMLTEKERPIISSYIDFLASHNYQTHMQRLRFVDGTQLLVEFLSCGDSDNGLDITNEKYEDLYEFIVKIKRIEKLGTNTKLKRNQVLVFDYRNFPTFFENAA